MKSAIIDTEIARVDMLTGNMPTAKQHPSVLTTFLKKGTPLLITCGMLGLFVTSYVFIPKSYNIYQQALSLAKKDPLIVNTLGEDITDAIFNTSNIARGLAKFEISISGTTGSGTLIVNGRRENDQWIMERVIFTSDFLKESHLVFENKNEHLNIGTKKRW